MHGFSILQQILDIDALVSFHQHMLKLLEIVWTTGRSKLDALGVCASSSGTIRVGNYIMSASA